MNFTNEEEKDVFYSLDNITESQYDLMKRNDNPRPSHNHVASPILSPTHEKFYEAELKDRQKLLILEDKGVKTNNGFCGFCQGASPPNTDRNESGCFLI